LLEKEDIYFGITITVLDICC